MDTILEDQGLQARVLEAVGVGAVHHEVFRQTGFPEGGLGQGDADGVVVGATAAAAQRYGYEGFYTDGWKRGVPGYTWTASVYLLFVWEYLTGRPEDRAS